MSSILSLVSQLYSGTSNDAITAADRALKSWQQSVEAWQVAEQVLCSPGHSSEAYYFMAQTIRTKIQYDWHQVPASAMSALRDLLFRLLAQSKDSRPVRMQLSVAVSDLALQMDESWSEPIRDIVGVFGGSNDVLIDLLRLLPEETDNMRVIAAASKRQHSRDRLVSAYPQVVGFLASQLGNSAPTVVLQCYLSWLRFYAPPPNELRDSALLDRALAVVARDETAAEVVLETLMIASRDPQRYLSVVERVFPALTALAPQALRASDAEEAKPLCKLFTVTGECLLREISEKGADAGVQQLLGVLLNFCSHPDVEVASYPLDFFAELAHESSLSGTGNLLAPVFERLLDTLVSRLTMSGDEGFSMLSCRRGFEEMHELRGSLLRTIQTVSSTAFQPGVCEVKLTRALAATLDKPAQNEAVAVALAEILQAGQTRTFYQEREPYKAIDEAGIKGLGLSGTDELVSVLVRVVSPESILECNMDERWRRMGFITLLGTLGPGLVTKASLNTVLDCLCRIVMLGMGKGPEGGMVPTRFEPQWAGADSIKKVMSCRKHEIAQDISVVNALCGAFVNGASVTTDVCAGLMDAFTEGLMSVLNQVTNDELFCNQLTSMLNPLLVTIRNFPNGQWQSQRLRQLVAICQVLKMNRTSTRASFFGTVIAPTIWQAIDLYLPQVRHNYTSIEQACRVIKHMIRAAPSELKPLIPHIAQRTVTEFKSVKNLSSSYLYMAEIIGDTYAGAGHGEDIQSGTVIPLFNAMTEVGLECVKSPDSNDMIIEDLYGMAQRYLKHSPAIVIGSPYFASLLETGISNLMRVNRRETFDSLFSFLTNLYLTRGSELASFGVDATLAQSTGQVLLVAAPLVVIEIFKLLKGACPRTVIIYLPGLLDAIRLFEPHAFIQTWLPAGIEVLPPGLLSAEEKQNTIKDICSAKDRRATEMIQEIGFRCEQALLRGAEPEKEN